MLEKVQVIGAGVSGLSTAVLLQEAGFDVTILSESFPPHTNSDKAGAIWFPSRVGPADKVAAWGRRTYDHFQGLAEMPETGVSMVDLFLLENASPDQCPLWAKGMPIGTFSQAKPSELPAGMAQGYKLRVPFIEPGIYLPYLMERFRRAGGMTEPGKAVSLENGKAIVVNCTGMGAGPLTGDSALKPIYGRTIRTGPLEQPHYLVQDENPADLAYIFSRRNETLLGGTATEFLEEDPDAAYEGIQERCRALLPGLDKLPVLGQSQGVRPFRPEIRLERDAAGVLHNYGHGGAGFTVSWGCAEAVLMLLLENKKYK